MKSFNLTTKEKLQRQNKMWAPMSILSPLTGESNSIVLSNPCLGKRFLLNRVAFLDMLTKSFTSKNECEHTNMLVQEGILDTLDNNEDVKSFRHWWKRGWEIALDYFLSSRKTKFFDQFDENTSKRRVTLEKYLNNDGPPPPRLQPDGEEIELGNPLGLPKEISIGEVLLKRRTGRSFLNQLLERPIFSSILWYGLNRVRQTRNAPSDEPLRYLKSYGVAFDFYIVIYAVSNIDPGIYFYKLNENALVKIQTASLRKNVKNALFGNWAPLTAAFTIFIVADFEQYQWRYRHERALRNLYIDTGRASQEIVLTACSHGLSVLCTPAIRDQYVCDLLKLDSLRSAPLYSLTLGINRDRII